MDVVAVVLATKPSLAKRACRYLAHIGVPTRDGVPKRAWDPVPIDPLTPDAFDA